ncbi:hypothetical protein [Achromobacter deleyi]|uniref:hypothetical protein n=1 Tax=Achromobacter deleyi TaxID=1353891 RepID=UPI0015821D58|nr:hypothetical protein [Achromobacter deleyi]
MNRRPFKRALVGTNVGPLKERQWQESSLRHEPMRQKRPGLSKTDVANAQFQKNPIRQEPYSARTPAPTKMGGAPPPVKRKPPAIAPPITAHPQMGEAPKQATDKTRASVINTNQDTA